MITLPEKLFAHLRLMRRRDDMLMFQTELPAGWVQSRDYCGPERRAGERRTGPERRESPRSGLNWWRSADRRARNDRRQSLTH